MVRAFLFFVIEEKRFCSTPPQANLSTKVEEYWRNFCDQSSSTWLNAKINYIQRFGRKAWLWLTVTGWVLLVDIMLAGGDFRCFSGVVWWRQLLFWWIQKLPEQVRWLPRCLWPPFLAQTRLPFSTILGDVTNSESVPFEIPSFATDIARYLIIYLFNVPDRQNGLFLNAPKAPSHISSVKHH